MRLKGTMKFTIKMLVIIRCLEVWRYFLEGAKSQFYYDFKAQSVKQ